MHNTRYDYLPGIKRERIRWPGDAVLAVWVCPNIEYFHFDLPVPGGAGPVPDVHTYSHRDYGSRVGVFRLMKVLDQYGIRASVLLNAEVCDHHPDIIEEGNKRNWEWLGHGLTNSVWMSQYPSEEERGIIREVRDKLTAGTQTVPKGWLGPGLAETFNTPDHLASEGFEYVCDWACDDQPVPMRVENGRLIAMPYQQGINDMTIFMRGQQTPDQYLRAVCDQFDTLYSESAESGKVMALPLHPFVIGLPFRIGYLGKALDYISSKKGVWFATGGEIAEWYYEHYYKRPV